MRKIQSVLVACAALAAASSASSILAATTGTFTGPLLSPILSVDINGGPSSTSGSTSDNEGYNSSLGSNQPDPFGVVWSPWGGATGFGGDGTQLPNSNNSSLPGTTSITKTFGGITATLSDAGTLTNYVNGAGTYPINSRDRGAPSGNANDNNLFRDLIFSGGSGANVQSTNYLQLSLSGLTPSTQYSIALYSFDTTGAHSMNWTATAPTNGTVGYNPGGTFAAPSDEQTITWTGGGANPAPAVLVVTTDASGIANVYGFGGNGVSGTQASDSSYINGFQISSKVPEPASAGLLGIAAAGMLARRSRKTV